MESTKLKALEVYLHTLTRQKYFTVEDNSSMLPGGALIWLNLIEVIDLTSIEDLIGSSSWRPSLEQSTVVPEQPVVVPELSSCSTQTPCTICPLVRTPDLSEPTWSIPPALP